MPQKNRSNIRRKRLTNKRSLNKSINIKKIKISRKRLTNKRSLNKSKNNMKGGASKIRRPRRTHLNKTARRRSKHLRRRVAQRGAGRALKMYDDCPDCGGEGFEVWEDEPLWACPDCKETGVVYRDDPVDCPDWVGPESIPGYYQVPCVRCGGVMGPDVPCVAGSGWTNKTDCNKCGGDKVIWGDDGKSNDNEMREWLKDAMTNLTAQGYPDYGGAYGMQLMQLLDDDDDMADYVNDDDGKLNKPLEAVIEQVVQGVYGTDHDVWDTNDEVGEYVPSDRGPTPGLWQDDY